MSTTVVLVPGAPVMVPGLSGSAAAGSEAGVREIVRALSRSAAGADRVHVLGTDPAGRSIGDVRTSLIRWGAPIAVGRADAPSARPEQVPDAAAIAWWLLDLAGIGVPRTFDAVDGEDTVVGVQRPGREIRRDGVVVVVADGPASLTPRAPIPEDPRGTDQDGRLAGWFRSGGPLPDPGPDVAADIGWWSRPAWLHLAALTGGRPADTALSWAPFGVGYHHATWRLTPDDIPRRTGGRR